MVVTPGQNWTQKRVYKEQSPTHQFLWQEEDLQERGARGHGAGTHRMAFRLRSMASGGMRLLAA